jgi:hypothetical protein
LTSFLKICNKFKGINLEEEKLYEKFLIIRSLPILILLIYLCYLADNFTAYLAFLADPEFFMEKEQNWIFKEALRTGNLWLNALNWAILSFFILILLAIRTKVVKKLGLQAVLFFTIAGMVSNILVFLGLKDELLLLFVPSTLISLGILPLLITLLDVLGRKPYTR